MTADHAGDERAPMTVAERTVWAYLITVVLTSAAYVALMVGRLLTQPTEEIRSVVPMLWTFGACVLGTVLVAVVATLVGEVRRGWHDRDAEVDLGSDVRDREIGRVGGRATTAVMGLGIGAALLLTMLHVDTFWIGNLLFMVGVASAIVETTTKIHLYRRGF